MIQKLKFILEKQRSKNDPNGRAESGFIFSTDSTPHEALKQPLSRSFPAKFLGRAPQDWDAHGLFSTFESDSNSDALYLLGASHFEPNSNASFPRCPLVHSLGNWKNRPTLFFLFQFLLFFFKIFIYYIFLGKLKNPDFPSRISAPVGFGVDSASIVIFF